MNSQQTSLTVSIIIPNWNGLHLLKMHLQSVIEAANGAEVIVVDDASNDGSCEYIKRQYPNVLVIMKDSHEGFPQTVNVGVSRAKGDIVILLNTDVHPDKNFLFPLLTHFQEKEVFAVGCLEQSVESNGTVLRGRGVAKWERGYYIHKRGEVDKTDTAWVSGGSGAFRKEIWNKLGGLDPLYSPFYWEDIDLSYRAIKMGYILRFEPKSTVVHYHALGKIKSIYSMQQINVISYRNQYIFIWKNADDFSIWFEHTLWIAIRLFQSMLSGEYAHCLGFLKALLLSPVIIRRRNQRAVKNKYTDHQALLRFKQQL